MDEARAHVERAISLANGDVRMRCALAALNVVTGRKQEGIEQLNELLKLSETRYLSPYFLSRVYLGLGNFDDTFDCQI